jgi:uncharacterized protein YndB with AHSA1/START domain
MSRAAHAALWFLLVVPAAAVPARQAGGDPPSNIVTTEGAVDAPVSAVWDAFTTKDGIESWMTATGDVDLRIGGLLRTSYRAGADLNGDTAIHQSILSIDPGRMLSFRTVKSPADFPFAGAIASTWTVIYFDAMDDRRTRVTVRMVGIADDAESQKMRAFFERGNKATIDSLVKRFAAR